MKFRWVDPAPADPRLVAACGPELGIPAAVAEILVRRGFAHPDAVKAFLRPHLGQLHPATALRGASAAAERLALAIERGERVVVYGDYDVDGITSTVLLTRVLRELGGSASWFIPHRLEHGYGLSPSGWSEVRKLAPAVLVCCDCGVGSVEEVRDACARGVDVIIADHHEPGSELPPAFALLNPKQSDCSYPERDLAAVGVTFKLCEALFTRLGRSRRELYRYLDLVALGTIADVVPALGENRVFMKFGLLQLARTQNPGLRALLQLTGLAGKPLTASAVGFVLGPRINAVGRMGSAAPGAELLLTDDAGEAERLAAVLEEENRLRRELDRRTLEEARALLVDFDPEAMPAIVLASDAWHPGVLGIVASRLVEEFYRPAVLVALRDGMARGSGRSIPSFHMYRALVACGPHLLTYGGHAAAGGLQLEPSRLESFRRAFEAHAREMLEPAGLVPEIRVDLELSMLRDCSELYRMIEHFAPFGPANPRPVFSLRDLELTGGPRVFGEEHVRLCLRREGHTLAAVGFRMAQRFPEVDPDRDRLSIAFTLEEDELTGRGELQARLLDLVSLPVQSGGSRVGDCPQSPESGGR